VKDIDKDEFSASTISQFTQQFIVVPLAATLVISIGFGFVNEGSPVLEMIEKKLNLEDIANIADGLQSMKTGNIADGIKSVTKSMTKSLDVGNVLRGSMKSAGLRSPSQIFKKSKEDNHKSKPDKPKSESSESQKPVPEKTSVSLFGALTSAASSAGVKHSGRSDKPKMDEVVPLPKDEPRKMAWS